MKRAFIHLPFALLVLIPISAQAAESWKCSMGNSLLRDDLWKVEGDRLSYPSLGDRTDARNTASIVRNTPDTLIALTDVDVVHYFEVIIIDKRVPSFKLVNLNTRTDVEDHLAGTCSKPAGAPPP